VDALSNRVILGVIPEFIPVLRLLTISAGLRLLR
jgi:hypothetical protein